MGMFDYVICRRPLPGVPPTWIVADQEFQTKDLDLNMNMFEITEEGKLIRTLHCSVDGERGPVNHTGTVDLFAAGPRRSEAIDGKSMWPSAEYRAVFQDGTLLSLEELEVR